MSNNKVNKEKNIYTYNIPMDNNLFVWLYYLFIVKILNWCLLIMIKPFEQ